jgi:DNA-binding MarR family transcriptional regulator
MVAKKISNREYRGLAELRFRIRRFVQEGDATARAAGLEPQQYLLLLATRGLPEGAESSIRTLADRLSLQQHSAVELVDRMEERGYVTDCGIASERKSAGGGDWCAAGEPGER